MIDLKKESSSTSAKKEPEMIDLKKESSGTSAKKEPR